MGGLSTPSTAAGSVKAAKKAARLAKHGITASSGGGLIAGGFADDGARQMPSLNDPLAAENARLRLLRLQSGSGRASTDLSGTRPFVNTFLGGTK